VQVAVSVKADDERWTEGSLTVQSAFISAAAFFVQGVPLQSPNKVVALKAWLLPGAAAVWFAVAVAGVTFKPIPAQQRPPQPMVARSNTPRKTPTKGRDPSVSGSNTAMAYFMLVFLSLLDWLVSWLWLLPSVLWPRPCLP
jgi:hypothetical protein